MLATASGDGPTQHVKFTLTLHTGDVFEVSLVREAVTHPPPLPERATMAAYMANR